VALQWRGSPLSPVWGTTVLSRIKTSDNLWLYEYGGVVDKLWLVSGKVIELILWELSDVVVRVATIGKECENAG
jgi:hypothetical protein